MATQTLDCKGLNCPMPIVEITKATKKLSSGDQLEVFATDLAFKLDLEAWSRRTGNTIREFDEGEVQRALIVVS